MKDDEGYTGWLGVYAESVRTSMKQDISGTVIIVVAVIALLACYVLLLGV